MNACKIPLKVVTAPAIGAVVEAPPVLIASELSVDYTCGRCGTENSRGPDPLQKLRIV
jgi:hypothetical protein